jgi:translation initiation factor 4B
VWVLNPLAAANRREFAPSAAEESNQWRRATPLAPREAPAMAPRRGSSFNSPTEPGPDRDWGAARGARFVPAPPASGLGRDSSGMGREREGGREREVTPTVADDASQWRSAKPLVTPASAAPGRREAPPHQAGVGAGEAPSPSLAETESTVSRRWALLSKTLLARSDETVVPWNQGANASGAPEPIGHHFAGRARLASRPAGNHECPRER